MIGRGRIVAALLLGAFLTTASAGGAEPTPSPGPALSAREVVEIQLDALQRNDRPNADAGIATTWRFAHPDNRRLTGPLERFTAMLKAPAYRLLLNHRGHSVEVLESRPDRQVFAVTVISGDGPVVIYEWEVAKVVNGPQAGAWMTVAVSPPMLVGRPT